MKIIRTGIKNNSQWTDNIVASKTSKYASLSVDAGNVNCPMTGKSITTISCEICEHCCGSEINISNSNEYIKCSHENSVNIKTASKQDEVERLYVSEKVNTEKVLPEDLKSIFARSTSKFEDLNDNDIISSHKITSSKNINESENDGTSNFVPKYSNSIFNPEIIAELEKSQKLTEEQEQTKKAETKQNKISSKKEWETDTKKQLEEIEFTPKGTVMSISHDTGANNPDVSEYKFSIFENIDDKLKAMAEKTDGEKLKEQSVERKTKISRTKEVDDWESNSKKNTTTSSIVKDFFENMLGEK